MRIKFTVLTEGKIHEEQLKVITDGLLSEDEYQVLKREKKVTLDQSLYGDDGDDVGSSMRHTMVIELFD